MANEYIQLVVTRRRVTTWEHEFNIGARDLRMPQSLRLSEDECFR